MKVIRLVTEDEHKDIINMFQQKMHTDLLDKVGLKSQYYYNLRKKWKDGKFYIPKIKVEYLEKLLTLSKEIKNLKEK